MTEDLLAKRWAGIEKVAREIKGNVLDLVRLVLQRRKASGEFTEKFRKAFKDSDATFQMYGNDLELAVLAGSVLRQMFTQTSKEGDTASLAVLCAVQTVGGPAWIKPFADGAEAYLDTRLRELRAPVAIAGPAFSEADLKSKIDVFVKRLSANEPGPSSEAAGAAFESLREALSGVTRATASAVTELERQSALRKQETDVLCWLTAGVSRDLGVVFSEMKPAAAALVAGKELADLVGPPGTLPAKSVLKMAAQRAAGKSAAKGVALHTGINATDAAWRESLVGRFAMDRIADMCPLLDVVKHSLSTENATGWIAAYKKAHHLDPKVSVGLNDLSYRFYRECLLAQRESQP